MAMLRNPIRFRPRMEVLEHRRVLSSVPLLSGGESMDIPQAGVVASHGDLVPRPAKPAAGQGREADAELAGEELEARDLVFASLVANRRQEPVRLSGQPDDVRVAVGDVNGDGVPDIVTALGPGSRPVVNVIDGQGGGRLRSFLAYDAGFRGGVFVATGDLNGDGVAEIITGVDAGGGPHVKVFDGVSGRELRSFLAYSPSFTGGVRVATGDVTGDGRADIVTGAGPGGGPHVKVFDGATGAEVHSFLAYAPAFQGGVYVAAGDISGDGVAEIVTGAGAGGGPHVKVFDGASGREQRSFMAYSPSFTGGVRVATGDVTGDGAADIVTGAGPGGGPHVKVFDGTTGAETHSFFAFAPRFAGGVYVAAGDLNGDGFAEIVTGVGAGGGPHIKVFDGQTRAASRSFVAFGVGFPGGFSWEVRRAGHDELPEVVSMEDLGAGSRLRLPNATRDRRR